MLKKEGYLKKKKLGIQGDRGYRRGHRVKNQKLDFDPMVPPAPISPISPVYRYLKQSWYCDTPSKSLEKVYYTLYMYFPILLLLYTIPIGNMTTLDFMYFQSFDHYSFSNLNMLFSWVSQLRMYFWKVYRFFVWLCEYHMSNQGSTSQYIMAILKTNKNNQNVFVRNFVLLLRGKHGT